MIPPCKCFERSCGHYLGVTPGPEVPAAGSRRLPQRHYCEAFPHGIPPAIVRGDDPHETPRADDRGIQYERGTPDLYGGEPTKEA